MGEVNIHALNLPQLEALRKQLEEEIGLFTANFNELKLFQQKFTLSLGTIDEIMASKGNDETLVPLTSSLYIPGKLVPDSQVLVDIGAGFLVARAPEDAKNILSRRIGYLKANTDSLMKVITSRQGNLAAIRDTILERRQQQQQQQGGATSSSSN